MHCSACARHPRNDAVPGIDARVKERVGVGQGQKLKEPTESFSNVSSLHLEYAHVSHVRALRGSLQDDRDLFSDISVRRDSFGV